MTTPPLLERLERVSTTSLADAAPSLRVLPPALRPVAPGRHLVGRAVTARAHRDLMSVIHALREAGPGDVLVVDAGGDERAVAGELFCTEAQRRGLAGLVIHGRSRDTAAVARLTMPVWSTGFAPNAYGARALPETGVDLSLDGVRVSPGDLVVGDDDGLVVGSEDELAAAADRAETIEAREKGLQARILEGTSLFDVMNYDEHLAALREGREGGLAFG
ncbi:MAG TPA: RraA family protein [Phycicoccus sp.]